jgi:hypothetical protein
MFNRIARLSVCFIAPIALAISVSGAAAGEQSRGAIVLAQLSPQQAAQCQQEAAQLNAQLAQCTTEACRQSVQAAIAAHNQRCQ